MKRPRTRDLPALGGCGSAALRSTRLIFIGLVLCLVTSMTHAQDQPALQTSLGLIISPTPLISPPPRSLTKPEPRTGTGRGASIAAKPLPKPNVGLPPRNLLDQTHADAATKSAGCIECHTTTDAHTMHVARHVVLGCTDCHGGNPQRGNPYLGYTWWDQETDGAHLYSKNQREVTDAELVRATVQNPEAAAARGLWGIASF